MEDTKKDKPEEKHEDNENTQAELYGEDRNVENDNAALCAAITIIVLSIFSFNIFVLLLGLFGIIALNSTQDVWKSWKRVVSVFYYISIVVLIIIVFASLIILIIGLFKVIVTAIGIGAYLFLLSIFELYYSRKLNNAIAGLYTPMKDLAKKDKTYGTESSIN